MYEVESRALVNSFDKMREKLDSFAKKKESDVREVTVFLFNPHKDDFELRLRLQKERAFLNFKESLNKIGRKEIESNVSDPVAIYDLLLHSGFKVKQIIARTKYTYLHDKFEILLNRIVDWGDAMEVETIVNNETQAEQASADIKEFMNSILGVPELLSKERLKELNAQYQNKVDFEKIHMQDLLDYVNEKKDSIRFI